MGPATVAVQDVSTPAAPLVVTVGNAFLDRIVHVPGLPAGAGKMRASSMAETGGGIAATAACAAARLGGRARCIARVGDDGAGNAILARLSAAGVDVSGIHRAPGARSQQGTIVVEPGGERMAFGFMGDGLPEAAGWVDPALFEGAGGVMVDYGWPPGAELAFAQARRRGAVSVLDADVGDLGAVRRLMPLADHVVFSLPCLLALTGAACPASGLAVLDTGADNQASVTAGSDGFFWRVGGTVHHLPAFPVRALDTNGAGDVFHGAYALALAEGMDVPRAGRFANAAAALKCATGSGWESIPDRPAVERLLHQGDG